MAQHVHITTDEVFAMFSLLPDIDPDAIVDGEHILKGVIYKAKAAKEYQDATGDKAMNITITKG